RYSDTASQVDLRPQLLAGYPYPVCILLSLLLVFNAMVEIREQDRVPMDDGSGTDNDGMRRISISTFCIRCFVRLVSDGTSHSGRGNYRAPGGRKSVRGPIREAGEGIKPSRLNTSVQLFGHGNRAKDRRNPDSECRAIGL